MRIERARPATSCRDRQLAARKPDDAAHYRHEYRANVSKPSADRIGMRWPRLTYRMRVGQCRRLRIHISSDENPGTSVLIAVMTSAA